MLHFEPLLAFQFDELWQTPLHWAAIRQCPPIVTVLIETGCNLNAKDVSGRTALYIAAMHNSQKIVKMLILAGANPFIRCHNGVSPKEVTTDEYIQIYIK